MSSADAAESTNWRAAGPVAAAGAVGGFLSWCATCVVAGDPSLARVGTVLAIVALGAGAAAIGVYVVPGADTTKRVRCFAFALVCGFSWQIVYEGAGAFVKESIETREEQSADEDGTALEKKTEELAKTPAAALPQQLESAANAAIALLRKSSSLDRVPARARALEAVERLTTAMTQRMSDAPAAVVDALADVAQAAAECQAANLTRQVWEATEASSVAQLDASTAGQVVAAARARQPAVQRAASRSGDTRLAAYLQRSSAESALATGVRLKESSNPDDAKRCEALRLEDAARDLEASPLVKPRSRAATPQPLAPDAVKRLANDPDRMRKYLIDRNAAK